MKKTLITLLVSLGFIIAGCSCKTPVNPCEVQIGSHPSVTPVVKKSDWWLPRHQSVLERIKQGNVNLIFVGDSITNHWEREGKDIWTKYYEPRGAVNMGFSGDRTQNVLWRLQNGEIDNISPKLAVVMIGTNNSSHEEFTSEDIADGVKAIVCKLRTNLPDTKILVLSIFPRGSKLLRNSEVQAAPYNDQWAKNDKANRIVSEIADNRMIYYLDINDCFLDKNGCVTRDVMPDFLHLSKKGYQLWAEAMEPTIKKLMDE